MTCSRRSSLAMLAGILAGGLAGGCSFYREPPPVVIGGSAVEKSETVMAALRASSDHRRFVAALDASGVAEELQGIGPLTVFAPTDAAFAAMRPKVDAARLAEDPEFLERVMLGHILRTVLTTEDLAANLSELNGSTRIFAANGQVLSIAGEADAPTLYDRRKRIVRVVTADAIASNGILHVTDGVLLPEVEKPAP